MQCFINVNSLWSLTVEIFFPLWMSLMDMVIESKVL